MKPQIVKSKTIVCALGAITTALMLNSCLVMGNKGGIGGDGTVGQQLVDLQKAKNAGLLSEKEYQRQRNKALGYPENE